MMKKVCILLFMVLVMGQFQAVYAQSYSVWDDVEEVCIGHSSPNLNECDIYSGYSTTNENEIKVISHFLNTLKMTEGGGVPTDTRFVRIVLKYNNGDVDDYRIYPSRIQFLNNTEPMEVYEISICEYYRMCDFINGLLLNEFDSNTDVSMQVSKWAEENLDCALSKGLIPEWNQIGYANNITRVEVCQLIDNLLSIKGVDKEITRDYTYLENYPFNDTKDVSVKELYIKGIISGKSETEFYPYDYITREEFAKILSNTCEVMQIKKNLNSHIYADQSHISDWAKEDVDYLYQLDIMSGKGNNEFKPKDTLTKEEAIVAILRLNELQENKDVSK